MPWRPGGIAPVDRVFVSCLKFFPLCPHFEIAQIKLPVLGRITESGFQAFFLFFLADVEEKFQQDDIVLCERLFEGVNLIITRLPDLLGIEPEHTHDKDIFVMRTVKNANHSPARFGFVNPPEKIMGSFLGGRDFEIRYLNAGRVRMLQHCSDGPILATGVHSLQNQQHGVRTVRKKALLQLADVQAKLVGFLPRFLFI